MRTVFWPQIQVLGAALAFLGAVGCDGGSAACTEIGCESQATVSYSMAVAGPYDLVVVTDGETITARCNDEGSLEAQDNPEDLKCDAGGFEVVGLRADRLSSAFVTVVEVETDATIYEDHEVLLSVVEEMQPNGPDCPPLCTVRAGQL